jgi:DNA-binding response OmpR family regulator
VSGARILLVEDEAPIREGLAGRLRREGYEVIEAATKAAALAALGGAPELVILDRRLPDGEGLEVLKALRAGGQAAAVIVLSARGMTEDRIEGLEGGADDYVTKPFHLRELLARVKSVLARKGAGGSGGREIAFGPFTLDVGARCLKRGRREILLSRLEFGLLHYLATHPGRAIDRAEILDRVWGEDRFPTTRTVDFHVLSLRRKIEAAGAPPRHILTVQGVGYRFEP